MPSLNYSLYFSSKRKTIALQVKQGQLIVRAPSYLSDKQVAQFVETKRLWIDKKLLNSHTLIKNSSDAFNYCCGDKLFVFGEECLLRIQLGSDTELALIESVFFITLTQQQFSAVDKKEIIKELIQQWFNEQIKLYIRDNLFVFEKRMGLYSTSTKVRIYKSRWGSCNSKKQLTFNALLAMAPKRVIDYVIVHELSHLRHMNHSTRFWQLVSIFCPDFMESKQWLKTNQKMLFLPE